MAPLDKGDLNAKRAALVRVKVYLGVYKRTG
jgi:hypothetical protein